MSKQQKYVLQLCHDYTFPFLDVARQYASLFKGTEYKVITVYLIGKTDQEVVKQTDSDEVIFFEYPQNSLKGLKRKPIKQIKELHKHYQFEFAIGHRYQVIYILRHIKQLPVIGVNHSFGKFKRWTRRWFLNTHKKNLYLLGVSNAVRDDMRASLPNFPKDQIQTLYNHIDIDKTSALQVDKKNARDFLGIKQEQYVFANVGRLHPDKDQKTLIDAFARVAESMPDALLMIIGKGRLESALKQQVKALNLEQKVRFTGVIPNVVKYFKAFDCFVLSSDHEPFGMVLLEAIIAGVPVIATNAGGAREIIRNEQCLFGIGDSQTLADLMLTQYQRDENTISRLTKINAQIMEQNFTDEIVKQSFWSLPFLERIVR